MRNLHRWQKFYTAAGSDGSDKFHLCAGQSEILLRIKNERGWCGGGMSNVHCPRFAHDCPRPMRNSLIWKIWAWARLSRGLGHSQRLGGRVLLRVISESHRIYLDVTDLCSSHFIHFTLITMVTLVTLSLWLPNHFCRTVCTIVSRSIYVS